MLSSLFRIGRGENHGRRPAVAELHGAGRVLPERPATDVDRLAHGASAALVSRRDGSWNAGAGARVDDVPAAAHAHFVLPDYHALADWHHPFGKLHVPELPGAGSGDFA